MAWGDLERRWNEAWHAMWRIERDPASGVTLAMPLTVEALEIRPAKPNAAVIARGSHMVTWIGVSAEMGLVQADAEWITDGPLGTDVPPKPEGGWKPCSPERFASNREARGIDGRTLGEFGSYVALPLPARANRVFPDDATIAAASNTRKLLVDFVTGIGLPRPAMAAVSQRRYDDTAFLSRFGGQYRPTMSFRTLAWLLGNDASEGVPAGVASLRRIQAVQAMPLFADYMCHDPVLTDAIDTGRELVREVARRVSCEPSTVRILNAAALRAGNDALFGSIRDATFRNGTRRMFDAMPVDTLRNMAHALSSRGWRSVGNIVGELHTPMERQLGDRIARELKPDGDGSWTWLDRAENAWPHMVDVAQEIRDELLWPGEARSDPMASREGHRSASGRAASLALLTSIPPRKLARVLDDHLQGTLRRAAEVDAAEAAGLPEWEPLAEPVIMGGRVMRFLTTRGELAHEGAEMGHCVAGYTDACIHGRCAILSVGDWVRGEWKPSSTVEIVRSGDGSLSVAQHRGPGNRSPSEADREALAGWRHAAAAGEVPCREDLLNTGDAETIEVRLGSAWRTPEAHAARWDRWRRILDVRHRGAGEFAAAALADIVDPASPGSPGLAKAVANACGWLADMDEEMKLEREVALLDPHTVPEGGTIPDP